MNTFYGSRTIIVAAVALSLLTACGGGDGEGGQDNETTMKLNKTYPLKAGDKIEKKQEGTTVAIETDIKSGDSNVTLITGQAVIVSASGS